ncbi:MAG TPA: hypothetical protein VJ810_29200 [Blastocatellia bacterium]|nr:hypothetical protein [Blastocatellia bacterium]
MRSGLVIVLIAGAVIGLGLAARGCSERKGRVVTKLETVNNTVAGDKAQPAEFSLSAKDDEGFDLPERDEIRQKYRLTSEAMVSISDINGKVKVDSSDADVAEILIVHSARRREDLQYSQVKIQQGQRNNKRTLFIWHENDSFSPGSIPESRQRVILRLPRNTGLEIHDMGGDVTIGEIHGSAEVTKVDGAVRVARAAGPIKIEGIIGAVDMTFAPFAGNEARITHRDIHRAVNKGPETFFGRNAISVRNVNGDVDLRFEGEVNADVNAWRVAGNIAPDLPNVERLPAEPPVGRLKARIGGGGASIEIQQINGNVTLSKAGDRDASAAKAVAK